MGLRQWPFISQTKYLSCVKNMMMCRDHHTQTDVQMFENWLLSLTSCNNLLLHTTIWVLTNTKIKNYYRLWTSELNPGFAGKQSKFTGKRIINVQFQMYKKLKKHLYRQSSILAAKGDTNINKTVFSQKVYNPIREIR